MVSLDQHPTVLHHRAQAADRAPAPIDAGWMRFLARERGLLAFGRCFPS
jgi:hypothetical protein